jgi:predicted dehydrogenase
MKISIVGCGGISRTHIGAVRDIPDARIISVADCGGKAVRREGIYEP